VVFLWKTENILKTSTAVGIHVFTGEPVEVRFEERLLDVRPADLGTARTYIAPGFIDLQVNGFSGIDYCSTSVTTEQIGASIQAQFATGVTRLLPTVITGPAADMLASIRNLARAKVELGSTGEAIAGLHIEGPHISAEDGPRGVHPRDNVRPPSIDEFEQWQHASGGLVRMVTLAPELPGACSYIEGIVKRGVVAAIGHTAANAGQIDDAVSAGATMATHLGNATFPAPSKFNALWNQLADDRLAASVIADGFHLPGSFLTTALRTKSAARLVLVTDAASPAGALPGRYRLGATEIEMDTQGRVTLADGSRLAGSGLRMDRAVPTMMRLAGATLAEAISMATVNPARLAGIAGRKQGLEAGEQADLVEFEQHWDGIRVRRVWLAGRMVHSALQ